MVRRRRAYELGELLGPSLNAGPAPTNGRDLVRYLGGQREAARFLSGMDGPPGRRARFAGTDEEYAAARTRWNSAQRRVQRATAAPGRQQRGQVKGLNLSPADKRAARRAATARKREDAAAAGLRSRMRARVVIPSPGVGHHNDSRMKTMPASGPGVYISRAVTRQILDEVDQDPDGAAQTFLEEFLDSYGMPPDTEVEDVEWLKLWPEGTPEPRST